MLCTSLWFFLHVIKCCCFFLFFLFCFCFCFCFCFSRDSHEAALSNILEVQVELLNNYGEHQNWRILNCFTHFFIFSFKKPKTMQRKHTIQFQKLQRKRWIKWYKKGLLFYLIDFWLTVLPENFACHPCLVAFLGLFYRQTTLLLVYLLDACQTIIWIFVPFSC